MENKILDQSQYQKLSSDLQILIYSTKEKIETFAKSQLVQAYWEIGKRISEEKMSENANYSGLVINDLASDLKIDKKTLNRAIQFFNGYPANPPEESSLSWSHYRHLITINDEVLRLEMAEKAKDEKWSAGKLGEQIKNVKTGGVKNILKRPTKANYLYRAKIINVIDGDTLLLDVDLGFDVIKRQRIRLAGIDAAEMKTSDGKKSFKYLRDLSASLNEVVVRTNKVDIFGRFIGDVFYQLADDGVKSRNEKVEIFENGVYLNEKIVGDGMAILV
ncbi:MAG: endonuclease YncB(thermonuclease family) [Myxococcota bacterium]|jgi:endonuclease YncB( thermonuclease family)